MTEIVVWGVCPVGIHVDVETSQVTRVVVIDEELRYPKDIDTPVMEGDLAVADTSYNLPWPDVGVAAREFARHDAAKALELARGQSGIWPAWDFGY